MLNPCVSVCVPLSLSGGTTGMNQHAVLLLSGRLWGITCGREGSDWPCLPQCSPAGLYSNVSFSSQSLFTQPRLAPQNQELQPKAFPKPIYSYR